MESRYSSPCGPKPPESASERLLFLLRRASMLIMRGRPQHEGLPPAQGRLLHILAARGPITRREMMELVGVRSGSLSEVINKLEKNQCLARSRDPHDLRGFMLEITDKGRDLLAARGQQRRDRTDQLLAGLSAAECAQLDMLLSKLVSAWEESLAGKPGQECHCPDCRGPKRRRHMDQRSCPGQGLPRNRH